MEVTGESSHALPLGPFTSTPRESSPDLERFDVQNDSLVSSGSESSKEDWLIKVCCPGARHRYCRHGQTKKRISSCKKTRFSRSLDKDDFTESAQWMPFTSYQTYTGVPRQESSDLKWLIRLRCPRAQMELMLPDAKQSLPAVSLSRSPSKICRDSQTENAKNPERWPAKKHHSITQAVVNETQDAVGSTQSLLERENHFVREVDRYLKHNDFLALRRKEMLYKKWFESVSRPLLQKIQDKVDNQSSEEIEERKRKQFSLYLNYCNKKVLVMKRCILLEGVCPTVSEFIGFVDFDQG
ncbi:hypothetical protein EYD10_16905 [Varanus komodoensis]|nr:hypothetical protein EYD10_16905 [Varanus komodoensis]